MNLEHLSEKELAGAWRRLCGAMIIQGAVATCLESHSADKNWNSRAQREQSETARDWVNGNGGVITFEEAAETLGLNAEVLRNRMHTVDVQQAARSLRRAHMGRSAVARRVKTTKLCVATDQENSDELLRQKQAGRAA
jgi:hypothetical protein